MKDSRTDLQKINDYQNYKYLLILIAVQIIAASIFYLLFFTWELSKEKRLEYLTPQTVPLFTFFQFFDNWIAISSKSSLSNPLIHLQTPVSKNVSVTCYYRVILSDRILLDIQ